MEDATERKQALRNRAAIAWKWIVRIAAFLGATTAAGLLTVATTLSKVFSDYSAELNAAFIFVAITFGVCALLAMGAIAFNLLKVNGDFKRDRNMKWSIWAEYKGCFTHKDYSIEEDNKIMYFTQSTMQFDIDRPILKGLHCSRQECDGHSLVSGITLTTEVWLKCPLCKTIYAKRPPAEVLMEAQAMFTKEVQRHFVKRFLKQEGYDEKQATA